MGTIPGEIHSASAPAKMLSMLTCRRWYFIHSAQAMASEPLRRSPSRCCTSSNTLALILQPPKQAATSSRRLARRMASPIATACRSATCFRAKAAPFMLMAAASCFQAVQLRMRMALVMKARHRRSCWRLACEARAGCGLVLKEGVIGMSPIASTQAEAGAQLRAACMPRVMPAH